MNPLAVQKQLLIAESELNRAQLTGDVSRLTGEMRSLVDRSSAFSSVLSYAKVLVAGLEAVGGAHPPAEPPKRSWWPSLRGGAQIALGLWRSFRSHKTPPNTG